MARVQWKPSRSLVLPLFFIFLICPSSQAAQKKTRNTKALSLKQHITSILQEPGAREAHWGIQVVSVRTGERIFGWNQEKLFVPASTAKLFTTATALVRLGPGFTYTTTIESTAPVDQNGTLHGDLVLVGRGDPNLSARVLPYEGRTERTDDPGKVLEDLAAQISARGIHTIDGDVIADDAYFVSQPYGLGWTVGDLVWGYGAPVSALAFNDNVITLTIHPGERPGSVASVRQEPIDGYFQVENRIVTTAKRQGPANRISLDRKPGSRVLRLWGEIPMSEPEFKESIAMDDPPFVAAEFLRQELIRRGVQIKGAAKVRRLDPSDVPDLLNAPAPTTASTIPLASHESGPLIQSLILINKVSQNLHAEMLLRTLGRNRRNVGSVEAGLTEVKGFLTEIGVPEEQTVLYDGSGLSRQTLVSPSSITALLRYMYDSNFRSNWIDTLPVGGVDGTLTNRLRQPELLGRVHAKTGSLAGVDSLAGYLIGRNNETTAVAIFVNHHHLSAAAAAHLIDRIVEAIAIGH